VYHTGIEIFPEQTARYAGYPGGAIAYQQARRVIESTE
jgi:hypothetical protein